MDCKDLRNEMASCAVSRTFPQLLDRLDIDPYHAHGVLHVHTSLPELMAMFLVRSSGLVTDGTSSDDFFQVNSGGLSAATINGGAGADTIELNDDVASARDASTLAVVPTFSRLPVPISLAPQSARSWWRQINFSRLPLQH